MYATQEMVPFLLLLISLGIYSHPLKKTGEQTRDTEPPTEPTTEPPCPGCSYETKCYSPGEEISRGSDGQGWCFGTTCSYDGRLITWDNWNCGPDTTTQQPTTTQPPNTIQPATATQPPNTKQPPIKIQPPTTTQQPTTTQPPDGCMQNGQWYPPNSEITHETDGKGWCYGTYCDSDGTLVTWDDWNCRPSTTTQPTTAPQPHGCFENEQWYSPGSAITQGSDGKGWCYGTYCDTFGNIVAWDDWNCISTTTGPSITNPTTAMPKPEGCFYNDKWFSPNKDISKECHETGWCHGKICGPHGHIVEWDGWKTAPTSGIPPLTKPTRHP